MIQAPAAMPDGGDGGGDDPKDDPEHIRRQKELMVFLVLNSPHCIFQKTEANKSTFYEPQS